MNLFICWICICVIVFTESKTAARRCIPLSEFLNDCDKCRCSENGESYTCYPNECENYSSFSSENTINYVKTKPNRRFPVKSTNIEIPYINDAIPSNSEETDDHLRVGASDKPSVEGKEIEDVSGEESMIVDTGIPDHYRLKRRLEPFQRHIKPAWKV